MPLIQNESGIAFGYAMILLSIVIFSVLWIGLSPAVNQITEDANEQVAEGKMSEQTAAYYDISIRVFTWVLPIGFLAVAMWWGITRANISGDD